MVLIAPLSVFYRNGATRGIPAVRQRLLELGIYHVAFLRVRLERRRVLY